MVLEPVEDSSRVLDFSRGCSALAIIVAVRIVLTNTDVIGKCISELFRPSVSSVRAPASTAGLPGLTPTLIGLVVFIDEVPKETCFVVA